VGIPGDRAICRIRPQADPFVTRCAKNTVGFKLRNIWICAKVFDAFFLGSLCPSALRWRVSKCFGGTLRSVNNCFRTGLRRGSTAKTERENGRETKGMGAEALTMIAGEHPSVSK